MRSLWDIPFFKFQINSCTKPPALDANGCVRLVGDQRKMGDIVLSGMAAVGRYGVLV